MQVIITEEPFIDLSQGWMQRGNWPASWVAHPEVNGVGPAVVAYRRRFKLDAAQKLRIHVSADERYELFLDGKRIGRGPERGDRENWFYETYDLDLSAGEHILVARSWWLGPDAPAPYAQHTVRPGIPPGGGGRPGGPAEYRQGRLGSQDARRILVGLARDGMGHGREGPHQRARSSPGASRRGEGDGWVRVQNVGRAAERIDRERVPDGLAAPTCDPPADDRGDPPSRRGPARPGGDRRRTPGRSRSSRRRTSPSETQGWNGLLAGKSLAIPANTMRRVIVDLGNYYCAYPERRLSGGKGAKVRIHWAESLYEKPEHGRQGQSRPDRGQVLRRHRRHLRARRRHGPRFDDALVGGRAVPGDARLTRATSR